MLEEQLQEKDVELQGLQVSMSQGSYSPPPNSIDPSQRPKVHQHPQQVAETPSNKDKDLVEVRSQLKSAEAQVQELVDELETASASSLLLAQAFDGKTQVSACCLFPFLLSLFRNRSLCM